MTAIDDVHPLFFLSYARSGSGEPDRRVKTFFNDLSQHVSELVSRRPGADPGFMDQSIRPGQRWTGELLRAVGTCDVFVPLLCVPYADSDWCGKEWYAFSQRRGIGKAKNNPPPVIIPVVWARFTDDQIPTIVGKVQRFLPGDMPGENTQAEYEQYGVSGLIWLERKISYRWVVWRLALEIARHHPANDHPVIHRTLSEEDLHDAFRENET
jgi:TIR domain